MDARKIVGYVLLGTAAVAGAAALGYAGLLWFASAEIGPSTTARAGLLLVFAIALFLGVVGFMVRPMRGLEKNPP